MQDLLIVSDVHICKLRPEMMRGGQHELPRFIAHAADHHPDGGSWRLIINGDLFDFDYQTDRLADRGPEEASLRLFTEIADEYPELFEAFARFLDRGHDVTILAGNHDLDLAWPSVRDALRARVSAQLADRRAIDRLEFRDWFYFERGRIYVEHGHQYEVDTAVPATFEPFESRGRLRISLATHWVCGYCPNVPEVAYHVDHTKSFLHYLPLLVTRYGPRAPILWLKYLAFTIRALRDAGARQQVVQARHLAKRREVGRASGLDDRTLDELEGFGCVPRLASRLATAARLHALPAFLLPIVLVLLVVAGATRSLSWAGAALVLLAIAVVTNALVSSRFRGDRKDAVQRTVASRLHALLEVPLVSMGHFHVALDERLERGRYVNSGTWMDPTLPYTYVRVRGHEANLRAWPADDLRS